MTTTFDPERTAYHEAGHALMALATWHRIFVVTIDPDLSVHLGGANAAGVCRWRYDDESTVEHRLMVLLGGFAADVIRAVEDFGIPRDWVEALELARQAEDNDDACKRLIMGVLDNTKVYVRENWLAIERLAQRLLNEHTVDGKDAVLTMIGAHDANEAPVH